MKAVLISIQPKWCELVASGKKTIEVRKTKPKLDTPFKVYIYETKGKKQYFSQPLPIPYFVRLGKVIGEFVCDDIECFTTDYRANEEQTERISKQSCVGYGELIEYETNSPCLYAWHISNLVIYDKPKELYEFHRKCEEFRCEGCEHLKYQRVNASEYDYECEYFNYLIPIARPPQSWCYVERLGEG